MALRSNNRDFSKIIEAGQYWRRQALEAEGSVFTNDPLWTMNNLENLNQFFVENLDWGEGSFLDKLKKQLANAGKETSKLAAEMLWLMQLCPSNVRPTAKRILISTVWEFSGETLPKNSPFLQDDVLLGVGSAGTAYNTNRWRELVFFINFMRPLRNLPQEEKHEILNDGWKFAKWIENIDECNVRQLRPMLLFLLFPKYFERIFGGEDRRAIVAAFENIARKEVKKLSALEIDVKLAEIRKKQQEEHPSIILDFYEAPLIKVWKNATGPQAMRNITKENVLQALEDIDLNGVPDDAHSTGYDLVHDGKTYPPKYVLSIAGKFANDVQLDRDLFTGGEDSQAFRHLRKLGFHIQPKNALASLIRKFLEQADQGMNLRTSGYLRKYRELDITVSFGKGDFARVPWIAFTGYEQEIQSGIYPLLLYYKTEGLLVLAYGKSETYPAELKWPKVDKENTIEKVFASKYQLVPTRYGTSYAKSIYQLPSGINVSEIEKDIDALLTEYIEFMESKKKKDDSESYTTENALEELFIDRGKFEIMLSLLKRKKNIILQGPPGVGKTFVCKRLAYALMEEKADQRIGMVQFHQTYSYEDFIQGYRPSGTGFSLKDGIFYQFCDKARQDSANEYVFIIDEINRGNLSKILGELMMLIETDKRGPDWAIPLAYGDTFEDKFYVPDNVYLIGLMNTADRSLAMVDYALRRRFAFVEILPGFETEQFYGYLTEYGAEAVFLDEMIRRLTAVNKKITEDKTNLGVGFCIGHSYFSSITENESPNEKWFNLIIENEIAPLLKEYWFDAPETAEAVVRELIFQ